MWDACFEGFIRADGVDYKFFNILESGRAWMLRTVGPRGTWVFSRIAPAYVWSTDAHQLVQYDRPIPIIMKSFMQPRLLGAHHHFPSSKKQRWLSFFGFLIIKHGKVWLGVLWELILRSWNLKFRPRPDRHHLREFYCRIPWSKNTSANSASKLIKKNDEPCNEYVQWTHTLK